MSTLKIPAWTVCRHTRFGRAGTRLTADPASHGNGRPAPTA
ncbi:hypothetical protein ACWGSE_00110 [Streptomyces diastaticus]